MFKFDKSIEKSCTMIFYNDDNLVNCCVIIFYHIRSDYTCFIYCNPFRLHMLDGLAVNKQTTSVFITTWSSNISYLVLVTCSSLFLEVTNHHGLLYRFKRNEKWQPFHTQKIQELQQKHRFFFSVTFLRPKMASFHQNFNGSESQRDP